MTAEEDQEPQLHAHEVAHTTAADADSGSGGGSHSRSIPWLLLLGFLFLTTFNSGMAIYWRSIRNKLGSAVSMVFSHLDLLLLLVCCLRQFEKKVLWILATALTAAFSYKVAAIMQVVAWVIVVATVGGGFYVFFIHEEKKKSLLAALGGVASPVIRLIADTAASMHAVGDPRLLRGLQRYSVPQWVTLPNGTSLRILGIGHIELEHFHIPNVYLVEGFDKSLISMSQLDREHGMHSCFGRGIGRIMLGDGTVVEGAILDENDGMYVLSYLEVP